MLNQGISFKITSEQIVQGKTRINIILDLKLEVQVGKSKQNYLYQISPCKLQQDSEFGRFLSYYNFCLINQQDVYEDVKNVPAFLFFLSPLLWEQGQYWLGERKNSFRTITSQPLSLFLPQNWKDFVSFM